MPIGSASDWKATVFDHLQALTKAVANMLNTEGTSSHVGDEFGGETVYFHVSKDHSDTKAVLGLLREVRSSVSEVWRRVVLQENRCHIDSA
jgi:glutamine synthetase type III